jgi:hypothetical protein
MINAITLGFLIVSVSVYGQEPDVRTRQLWDETLLSQRPAGKKPQSGKTRVTQGANPANGVLLGITLWRFRPSKPTDQRSIRALIHEKGEPEQEWTPERVAADTPLAEGQMVRISIESSQGGYLYVIDRDEYDDGTKDDPYLIFPTLAIRNGMNHLVPGAVVQIPPEDGGHFKVKRSRPDQIDEVLTFLITPKPLAEITVGDRQKLKEEEVARWQRQWRAKSYKLEDAAQQGKVYTVAEKQAARGERFLTSDDPLPQTMYHLDCKAGSPALLELPLRIAK